VASSLPADSLPAADQTWGVAHARLGGFLRVAYTDALKECRTFYAGLGIDFRLEQHGSGPEHYAATLEDGTVFELYPAASQPDGRCAAADRRPTQPRAAPVAVRSSFSLKATSQLP
jgi:hypothetical protein